MKLVLFSITLRFCDVPVDTCSARGVTDSCQLGDAVESLCTPRRVSELVGGMSAVLAGRRVTSMGIERKPLVGPLVGTVLASDDLPETG